MIRQGPLLAHDGLGLSESGDRVDAGPVFTVTCLGPFECRLGDAPVSDWPREKSRELLAFLAAHGGAPVSRESVADAMWPNHLWDASLRHTIANAVVGLRSMVRSAAGDPALQPVVTAHQRYQLQASLFRVDLDAFELALRRAAILADAEALAEYERAVALYAGDFLAGEPFPWLDSYRSDYRQRLLDGAHQGARIARRLGEAGRAAKLYRVILDHDPIDEAAAREQMRLLAATGNLGAARRVHRDLTESLRQELDDPLARPSPETAAVLEEAMSGLAGPST